MNSPSLPLWRFALLLGCACAVAAAQQPQRRSAPATPAEPLPMPEPAQKIVAQFDRDGDQRLDDAERAAARAFLARQPAPAATPPGPANRRPTASESLVLEPIRPGEKITPAQAPDFADQPLYEPTVLRTLFLEFAEADWAAQLADFSRTDVQVPARLTVDGRTLSGVGVHFPALPAGTELPPGYKRPLTLALDFTRPDQQFGGERLLQLDDARDDPTLVRGLLYRKIARAYLPTPVANHVRLVVNGEFRGVYVNRQPLDLAFARENFGAATGPRWLALGRASLAYLGDDPAPYREHYRLLTAEDPAAWSKLIRLCRTLDRTPLDQLADALAPQLDVDRALRFLALETALINQGGYTGAGRGYGLLVDGEGRFQLIPLATESSLLLLAESQFENAPRGGPPRNPPPADTASKSPAPAAPPAPPPNGTPADFPKQNATDLALLLSHSFVNKVDRNEDLKLSQAEWLEFARAWFVVVDEDSAGEVSLDQLTTSVRHLVTPASMRNPRAKQTFAGDDAATLIALDLWSAMNRNRDERVSREEFTATFAEWFTTWADPKLPHLTQPVLQRGFETLFSRSVFQADQIYVRKRAGPVAENSGARGERGGRGDRGSGGESGPNVGGSLSVLGGPVGLGSRGGNRNNSSGGRTVVTYYTQLAPLGPLLDADNVLHAKLLAAPSLRARYLGYVREIADTWLDWKILGPFAKTAHAAIAEDINRETYGVHGYIRFVQDFDQDIGARDGRGRDSSVAPNLKTFVEERRAYLRKNTPEND